MSTATLDQTLPATSPAPSGPAPLSAPKRRDVKAITAALSDTKAGDHVVALFRDERYGLYQVVGKTATSAAYDGLVLAGAPLGVPGRVASSLLSIAPVSAGIFTGRGTDPDIDTLTHGQFITAWFQTNAWGSFTISGHLVALGREALMLGGWFVRSKGNPGAHVRGGILLPDSLASDPAPSPAIVRVEAA